VRFRIAAHSIAMQYFLARETILVRRRWIFSAAPKQSSELAANMMQIQSANLVPNRLLSKPKNQPM
jgi:hypothetical protein